MGKQRTYRNIITTLDKFFWCARSPFLCTPPQGRSTGQCKSFFPSLTCRDVYIPAKVNSRKDRNEQVIKTERVAIRLNVVFVSQTSASLQVNWATRPVGLDGNTGRKTQLSAALRRENKECVNEEERLSYLFLLLDMAWVLQSPSRPSIDFPIFPNLSFLLLYI